MKWLKRIALGFVAVLLVAVALGAIYQRAMFARDAERFPMPGQLVDVGGRRLHLYCTGSGSPTVVLENGLGANYTSWQVVRSEERRVGKEGRSRWKQQHVNKK